MTAWDRFTLAVLDLPDDAPLPVDLVRELVGALHAPAPVRREASPPKNFCKTCIRECPEPFCEACGARVNQGGA